MTSGNGAVGAVFPVQMHSPRVEQADHAGQRLAAGHLTGAGGREHAPLRLHESHTVRCIGMDIYAFGAQAPALAEALRRDAPA